MSLRLHNILYTFRLFFMFSVVACRYNSLIRKTKVFQLRKPMFSQSSRAIYGWDESEPYRNTINHSIYKYFFHNYHYRLHAGSNGRKHQPSAYFLCCVKPPGTSAEAKYRRDCGNSSLSENPHVFFEAGSPHSSEVGSSQ